MSSRIRTAWPWPRGPVPAVIDRMVAEDVHVTPHPRNGGWVVGTRWFATPHEARDAARRAAGECGARRIWMHDRYHRVRAVRLRP